MNGPNVFDHIPEQAYRELEAIVGPEHATANRAARLAYVGRGFDRQVYWFHGDCRMPAAIFMPKTVDEVVRLVKTCNRWKIPFIPQSTYGMAFSSPYARDDVVYIDMKRMDRMIVDDKNMYVILEPGVVYAQLQGEILKRDLCSLVPGGGGQVSALVNAFLCGMSIYNYRITILSGRRLNGVEWVTPEGDVYRLGSLASGDDNWFWQDGPGPNVTGFLKGLSSWAGSMGIVTRISYKLYPFQTEKLEPTGMGADACVKLPPRVQFYTVSFPDEPTVRNAIREMARARIGACVNRVPAYWRDVARARGDRAYVNTFWDGWNKTTEEDVARSRMLRVLLVGYASLKQLQYEERVLMDIIKENKGTLLRSRQVDETVFFAANSQGMWKATQVFGECNGIMESPRCVEKCDDLYRERMYKYQQEYPDDFLHQKNEYPWYLSVEFGRIYYSELQAWPYGPKIDPTAPEYDAGNAKRYLEWRYNTGLQLSMETGALSFFDGQVQPVGEIARVTHDYSIWLERFKKEFDPNGLASPGHPFLVDKFLNESHPDVINRKTRKMQKEVAAARKGWLGNR